MPICAPSILGQDRRVSAHNPDRLTGIACQRIIAWSVALDNAAPFRVIYMFFPDFAK